MVAEGFKELISWSKYKKWSLLHLTGWWLSDMPSLISKEDEKKKKIRRIKWQRWDNQVELDHFQGVASARLHDRWLKGTSTTLRLQQGDPWGVTPEPQRTAGFWRVSKDASCIPCTNKENEVGRGKATDLRSHREVRGKLGILFYYLIPCLSAPCLQRIQTWSGEEISLKTEELI